MHYHSRNHRDSRMSVGRTSLERSRLRSQQPSKQTTQSLTTGQWVRVILGPVLAMWESLAIDLWMVGGFLAHSSSFLHQLYRPPVIVYLSGGLCVKPWYHSLTLVRFLELLPVSPASISSFCFHPWLLPSDIHPQSEKDKKTALKWRRTARGWGSVKHRAFM